MERTGCWLRLERNVVHMFPPKKIPSLPFAPLSCFPSSALTFLFNVDNKLNGAYRSPPLPSTLSEENGFYAAAQRWQ